MALALNTTYLNRTPNKTPRENPAGFRPEFVVMHETAGYGSLEWNLRADVRSSYNYLINRAGVIFHYVDENRFIAWGAGVRSRWSVEGQTYTNGQINVAALNVELEGPNDGQPITLAQFESGVELIRHFNQTYGIPMDSAYYPEHHDVAPGYKSDARGYDARILVAEARRRIPLIDRTIIGAPQFATRDQIERSLLRNQSPLPMTEVPRIYTMCDWLQVDMAALVGMWRHEGGKPLGGSELQVQTRCPLNIKATDNEWRPVVTYKGEKWLAFESWQIGMMQSVLHLKNTYGWSGQHTVREIITRLAPPIENDTEAYIRSVLADMAYIRAH